ncbi:MAG: ABC transporter permease subunit [Syntrophobacteraceae bacterium]|nr:ABC transporter permease subunit [Syntrophobacteraceae bacterium]
MRSRRPLWSAPKDHDCPLPRISRQRCDSRILNGSAHREVVEILELGAAQPEDLVHAVVEETPDPRSPQAGRLRFEVEHLPDHAALPEESRIKPGTVFGQRAVEIGDHGGTEAPVLGDVLEAGDLHGHFPNVAPCKQEKVQGIGAIPGFLPRAVPMEGLLKLILPSPVSHQAIEAGIESVHPSQRAAARSLGLNSGQTLRLVVLPQAVRRVIPPLLNDLASLIKDCGLISLLGTPLDAIRYAQIWQAQLANCLGGVEEHLVPGHPDPAERRFGRAACE